MPNYAFGELSAPVQLHTAARAPETDKHVPFALAPTTNATFLLFAVTLCHWPKIDKREHDTD